MGFQQGLSGLNISSKALEAIGNNVANANTVGFKSARVDFADVYAASLSGGGSSQVGIGSSVSNIAQQFTEGNVTTTNNSLDLAINGQGMYRMSNDTSVDGKTSGLITYTRNGQFQLDKSGFLVNGAGLRVTGYAADATGAIVPGSFVDLQMSSANIAPAATTQSNFQLNLDSRATPPSSMTSGTITGSAPPASTVITAANNSFSIQVDGEPAVPVQIFIPIATYTTNAALATAVQTAINTDPTIAGQNTLVDVTLNTSSQMVITSRSSGTVGSAGLGSTVSLTAVAGNTGLANLMGAAPTAVSGKDNFLTAKTTTPLTTAYTGSTAQTVYDSLGNGHNLTMYFAKTSEANTWQMYTALDGVFTIDPNAPTTNPATAGVLTGTALTAGDLTSAQTGGNLSITVDGTNQTVYIPANPGYTVNTLATALQTALNTAFPGPAPAPTAAVTVANGQIVVTSGTPGGSSSVTVAAGAAIPALTTAGVFGGTGAVAVGQYTGTYQPGSADLGGTFTINAGASGTKTVTIPAAVYTSTTFAAALQTAANYAFDGSANPAVPTFAITEGAGVVTIDTVPSGGITSVTDGTAPTLAVASVFGTNAPAATAGTAVTASLVPAATTVSFTPSGALATVMPFTQTYALSNGAATPLKFSLDLTGTSQYGLAFGVNQQSQDGFTSGRLSGVSVSSDGIIQGNYSNGKSRKMGQVVLANFNNPNGLQSLGGNQWAETAASGGATPGTPGSGVLGVIQASAVEESNVDLTAELVNMITQQRVYQANAQTIKTQDQVLQTLVNLR